MLRKGEEEEKKKRISRHLPHTFFSSKKPMMPPKKTNSSRMVFTHSFQGILYYIDTQGNIYDTAAVIRNTPCPPIIGHYHIDPTTQEWQYVFSSVCIH
jgi:hypothetical protein